MRVYFSSIIQKEVTEGYVQDFYFGDGTSVELYYDSTGKYQGFVCDNMTSEEMYEIDELLDESETPVFLECNDNYNVVTEISTGKYITKI